MSSCNDCLVDMICTQQCPIFEVDMERLESDDFIYMKRCINNIEYKTYKISENILVEICYRWVGWYKNGQWHRSNDQPAVIFPDGTRQWYKNGQLHRDNDQPAVIYPNGTQSWYKNGVRYEFM